jgi:hypothetical protein
MDPWRFFAGYEHIAFNNPANALVGNTATGGYVLSGTINNSAYTNTKNLSVYWAGVKYAVSSTTNVTGAYYGYSQGDFSGTGCSDNSSASCSGHLSAGSLVVDDTITKHFNVYAGAMYSAVAGGLSNSYLYNNTLDVMTGMRISF